MCVCVCVVSRVIWKLFSIFRRVSNVWSSPYVHVTYIRVQFVFFVTKQLNGRYIFVVNQFNAIGMVIHGNANFNVCIIISLVEYRSMQYRKKDGINLYHGHNIYVISSKTAVFSFVLLVSQYWQSTRTNLTMKNINNLAKRKSNFTHL